MSADTPTNTSRKTKLKKSWWRILIEISVIAAIFFGIMAWQERHLLSNEEDAIAPSQILIGLDGQPYALPINGQKQLIYFFAPWCNICRLSIGNIESQKQSLLDKGYQVRYVALDWQTQDEVMEFVQDKKLTFPVLLGSIETMHQYQVKGFPTYYLVNEQGEILTGSQGYSTSLGIWLRSLKE